MKITKSQLREMVKESIETALNEQSQVGLRTSLENVMKYLIKRQNSAVGQSEFYEIGTHIETLKKLAEAL